MAFVGRHEIASQLRIPSTYWFPEHRSYILCQAISALYTGLKAIKALLSSATFSPNGSVMHTEHWRFEGGHNELKYYLNKNYIWSCFHTTYTKIWILKVPRRKILWEHRSINKKFQLIMQSASWTMKAKCKRCRPRDGNTFQVSIYQSKIESNDSYNFELCSILLSVWLFSILRTLNNPFVIL